MHRDLKSECSRELKLQYRLTNNTSAANILINNSGILKVADFGLARTYHQPPPQPGKGCGIGDRHYTAQVCTRWYRAPEVLLGLRNYTPAIDMWGVGYVVVSLNL